MPNLWASYSRAMPQYQFTYNAGTPKEWTSQHDCTNDDAALHSARCRCGAIDPMVAVDLVAAGGAKRLGFSEIVSGKLG